MKYLPHAYYTKSLKDIRHRCGHVHAINDNHLLCDKNRPRWSRRWMINDTADVTCPECIYRMKKILEE